MNPPVPAKKGWFKRGEAVATTKVCPSCKVAGPAQLQPGEVCVTCKTQQAWSDLGASGLVIDRAAIADAELRRAGEAAGDPLWKIALAWWPVALTLAIAAITGWSIVELMSPRPIGPLADVLAGWRGAAWRTTGLGVLALAVGIAALIRLRRRRHFRRASFLVSHGLAIVAGCWALVLGGVQVWGLRGGFGGAYTTMPVREPLAVTASVQRILDATVVVLAPDRDGDARQLGLGTGAIVAADDHRAWVVTCSHVAMPYAAVGGIRHARDAQPVWIQLSDGRGARARVRWAAPPPLDVVVIEVPIDRPPEPVTIAPDASALEPGASVTFVPLPYRSGWKVIDGELLRRETHKTSAGTYDLLFTNLPVTFGDSGSGLFDARGQLVGLNTWTRITGNGPAEGISLPSETMRAVVDAIERGTLDQLDDVVAAERP